MVPLPSTRRAVLGLGLSTALTAAPALVGCSPASAGPLRFWAMGREGEVVTELLGEFERSHPGIRVRVEQLPWTAAHEKLLTAFAGDATPDVAQLGNSWMPEFAALGALLPLQPWVDATPALAPADWFAGIWQTNVVGGQLLGLPWYVDTRLLFYRADMLARAGVAAPPVSWADWVAAMNALQRDGVRHPLLLPLNEFDSLLALALQQADALLRDGGRYGNFRSAGFARAAGFFLDRFSAGHAQPITNNQVSNLWQEFGRGLFAMFVSGPWQIGELTRRLGPARLNDWATAPLPGPLGAGASTAGGSSLVVFKRSPRQAQALALMAYLARPEVQQRFHALTGNLPPRRSTWQRAGADGLPLIADVKSSAFAQQLERVKPTPAVPEWERIAQEMQLQMNRAVAERWAPQQLGVALDARCDSFLEKRRWLLDRGQDRNRVVALGAKVRAVAA